MKKHLDKTLPIDERIDDLVSQMTVREKLSQMSNVSIGLEHLDIKPYNWWSEALHGVARAGKSTVFPQVIGMAASFNRDLIYQVYDAISDEARAKYNRYMKINGYAKEYLGITYWTPNINIFRDPRWGRGQETYGEDPFLTQELATQVVKGLQGNYHCNDYLEHHKTGKFMKTSACAKHYAVHSGPEYSRHEFNAKPNQKDFNETYMPAFERLCKEGVESFMTCYNRVYDEPGASSKLLLETKLRGEWNFKGHVVSDCSAINDIYKNHKIVDTPYEAVALAINGGCDLNCGFMYETHGYEAYEKGLISEETIEKNLKRLLRTKFKLGLMGTDLEDVPYNHISYDVVGSQKHLDLSHKIALESIVMLKNDGILPLTYEKTPDVMLTGPFIADIDVLLGNYNGMPTRIISLLDGIADVADEKHIRTDYRKGALPYGRTINKHDWAMMEGEKHTCSVIAVGYSSLLEGEEGDSIAMDSGDRHQIELPEEQSSYLDRYFERIDHPVVLVVLGGSPIALEKYKDKAAAIIFAWYPGQEGGKAIADVLFGNYSPSGRLPVTFPSATKDIPEYEDYNMKGRTYKYIEKTPDYPFGYGLSFADFSYDKLSVKEVNKDTVKINITVTNTSNMQSSEVTQVYFTDNKDVKGKPHFKLCEFAKNEFKGKQSKELSFEIQRQHLTYFDDNGELITSNDITIFCGGSQPDSHSEKLTGKKVASIKVTL